MVERVAQERAVTDESPTVFEYSRADKVVRGVFVALSWGFALSGTRYVPAHLLWLRLTMQVLLLLGCVMFGYGTYLNASHFRVTMTPGGCRMRSVNTEEEFGWERVTLWGLPLGVLGNLVFEMHVKGASIPFKTQLIVGWPWHMRELTRAVYYYKALAAAAQPASA